jgi:hypothetical protein
VRTGSRGSVLARSGSAPSWSDPWLPRWSSLNRPPHPLGLSPVRDGGGPAFGAVGFREGVNRRLRSAIPARWVRSGGGFMKRVLVLSAFSLAIGGNRAGRGALRSPSGSHSRRTIHGPRPPRTSRRRSTPHRRRRVVVATGSTRWPSRSRWAGRSSAQRERSGRDGGRRAGAVRCLYVNHAGAVVEGFTIRNGWNPGGFGGGSR